MRKNISGFTIVELLIVIVVIAILAAITIVAYNGIQQNARNSNTASAASAYLKGFALYNAANFSYPSFSGYACLGQSSCRGGTWTNSSAVDTALRTVMGSQLPVPSSTSINDNSSGAVALAYIPVSQNVTLDGVARYWVIYTLEGNVRCPVGPVVSGAWPTYSSTPPANGATNTTPTSSYCFVVLPNPG